MPLMHILCESARSERSALPERGSCDKMRNVKKRPTAFALVSAPQRERYRPPALILSPAPTYPPSFARLSASRLPLSSDSVLPPPPRSVTIKSTAEAKSICDRVHQENARIMEIIVPGITDRRGKRLFFPRHGVSLRQRREEE